MVQNSRFAPLQVAPHSTHLACSACSTFTIPPISKTRESAFAALAPQTTAQIVQQLWAALAHRGISLHRSSCFLSSTLSYPLHEHQILGVGYQLAGRRAKRWTSLIGTNMSRIGIDGRQSKGCLKDKLLGPNESEIQAELTMGQDCTEC
ncbi:hypothetical protein M378DRAFT_812876 [Amanita muscaria Koide BX008]|uniref:Uncharacterized protein n=1 Tax=Amanita muscaria (strain Koide BX008) TaxID=946122 RepID=A0A0C2WZP5_AMAMK|nr:hypothetical protein M378DRAFT_812876 [Amanita muscaria Koide BX008]